MEFILQPFTSASYCVCLLSTGTVYLLSVCCLQQRGKEAFSPLSARLPVTTAAEFQNVSLYGM